MAAGRSPRHARRRRWPLILLGVLAALVVFALGVGFGLTLEERPQPGGERTVERTVDPAEP